MTERYYQSRNLKREMTERLHSGLVGSVQEVLVEGAVTPKGAPAGCAGCPGLGDAADPRWFAGRSRGNHRVQFYAEGAVPPSPGDVVDVKIMRGGIHSLAGVSPPGAVAMEEDE